MAMINSSLSNFFEGKFFFQEMRFKEFEDINRNYFKEFHFSLPKRLGKINLKQISFDRT